MSMNNRTLLLFCMVVCWCYVTGCSLWHDDLPECPSGIDIEFVYDYNVQRADLFGDHVGGVIVNVFDGNDNFVLRKEECNTATSQPLSAPGYRMHLNLAPGNYTIVAHAFQRGHTEILSRAGAKFRVPDLKQGDTIDDLYVRLDRNSVGEVEHGGVALDTLWHGMTEAPVAVNASEVTPARISLVRNTNDLHITLHQLDYPGDICADDFEVSVMDANGKLCSDNSIDPDDGTIVYRPFAQWTSRYPDDEDREAESRAAHMQLSLSRLVYNPESARLSVLLIQSRGSGEEIARINLPECLAQGRNYFELQNYTPQEFLDREYSYNLDFFLKGDYWVYARLGISVLGWNMRIQNADL